MEKVIMLIGIVAIVIGVSIFLTGFGVSSGFSNLPIAVGSIIGGVFILGFARIIGMVAEIRDAVVSKQHYG